MRPRDSDRHCRRLHSQRTDGADRFRHERVVLRAMDVRGGVTGRQSPRHRCHRRADPGWTDRRGDGSMGFGGNSRTRDPRSDGAGALQPEPHPRARHVLEAAFGGNRDWNGRAFRRGRSDHRHRRRARIRARPVGPRDAARTKNPSGGRRRGRHGGNVRHAGFGGAARRRIAALRIPAAVRHSGGARERPPRPPPSASGLATPARSSR
jgi:hypothetical protein